MRRSSVAAAALDAAVVVATIAGIALVATHAVEFGSTAGNWVFPYVGTLDRRTAAAAVLGGVLAVVVYEILREHVETRPRTVVCAVLVGGIGVQLGLRALCPHAMGEVVVSDMWNGFYGAAARVRPLELLGDFRRATNYLPLHARHNMPGKMLFYYALRAITLRTDVLALGIVVLSSLGGVLLYLVCVRVFGSKAIGLDAMALWMLVPSKIGFHPILNVVSPLPPLVAVWCMLRYLDAPSAVWAVLAGVLAYATALFDPLALWIGVAFAPLIVRAVVIGRVLPAQAIGLVAMAGGALVAAWAGVRASTGFDLWNELLGQTRIFGEQELRPYDIWVVMNLKDIALAAGPAVTVAFLGAFLLAAWTIGRAALAGDARAVVDAGALATGTTLAVLGILEVIGFERGEVARLWIFLLTPVQVGVAWCLARSHAPTRWLVLAGTFAYATVTCALVGYLA